MEIIQVINDEKLPKDPADFLDEFINEDKGVFIQEEGILFDYKQEWPFSLTDNVGGSILKLIISLHNTHGGLIIFGVHDQKKTAGHNKTDVKLEKLNTHLNNVCSGPIECQHRNYSLEPLSFPENASVDILLVPKRPAKNPPVFLTKQMGKSEKDIAFIRKGPECITPLLEDIPFLFSDRLHNTQEQVPIKNKIEIFAPNNPRTMREFIGRLKILSQLWSWGFSKEKRVFLWGRAGSGKSAIAFEFIDLISKSAADQKVERGQPISQVLFFSAKNRELETYKPGNIREISADFSTKEELFLSILLYSDYYNEDEIEKLSSEEVEDKLEELLDTENILICIDDIDTLLRDGVDPGMDDLFQAVSRSRTGSKLLYTLRDRPSLAGDSGIEVTGLNEIEYKKFVSSCAEQFKVPPPQKNIIDGKLNAVSGRRPLILETIIGLRRSSSSYEEAIKSFEGEAGANPREYLFRREYKDLKDRKTEYVLACLALLKRPITSDEIAYLTKSDQETVRNSLSAIRDLFLSTHDIDGTDETRFSISEELRTFVLDQGANLTGFENLRQETKNFESKKVQPNISVERLWSGCKHDIARNEYDAALGRTLSKITPEMSAHPRFKELRAVVEMYQSPPDTDLIRNNLLDASRVQALDEQTLNKWFFTEKDNGFLRKALEPCSVVLNSKVDSKSPYRKHLRAQFMSKRGFVYFNLFREHRLSAIEEAIKSLSDACIANAMALGMANGTPNVNFIEFNKNLLLSLTLLARESLERDNLKLFVEVSEKIANDPNSLIDPIEEVLRERHKLFIKTDSERMKDQRFGLLKRLQGNLIKNPKAFSGNKIYQRTMKTIEIILRS